MSHRVSLRPPQLQHLLRNGRVSSRPPRRFDNTQPNKPWPPQCRRSSIPWSPRQPLGPTYRTIKSRSSQNSAMSLWRRTDKKTQRLTIDEPLIHHPDYEDTLTPCDSTKTYHCTSCVYLPFMLTCSDSTGAQPVIVCAQDCDSDITYCNINRIHRLLYIDIYLRT